MSNDATIEHKATTKSVLDLINLYSNGHLNLEPGFQRQSVWVERDRAKLIDSLLRNYPLPAIFLYKRHDDGKLIYDVIDGKQRLESILMFTGAMRGNRFWTRTELPGMEAPDWLDWSTLKRQGQQHRITGYEIPVIEVDGEIGDIIDVFVRINSTGKALTRQEQRNARYYRSPLLKEAGRLAGRFEKFLLENRILSAGQVSRMKHVELICELMLSLSQDAVLNKKAALDRVMEANGLDGRSLAKASRLVTATLNRVRLMFPQIRTTRLRQMTDFYSLVVLVGRFEKDGVILTDRRRNRLAWDLLSAFATRVDEVSELLRKGKGPGADQDIYRDYLMTVRQMTDAVEQRRKREEILRGVLGGLFERKDTQRGFTAEQRRILWNSSANRTCKTCGVKLTWEDFTIDHIDPYSKGGRSRLDNAALMCRKHNSAKGNRRR
jgi:hypothetical protein